MKGLLSYLRKKQEFTIGLCILVFAVIMLILLPSQVPEATKTWGVVRALPAGHRFFPIISLAIILIGGLLLTIDGYHVAEKTPEQVEGKAKEDYVGFWVTVASWAVYALLVMYIGYIVGTIILLIFLLRYYGASSWFKVLALTGGVSLFVYILFVVVMKLPFPHTALLF